MTITNIRAHYNRMHTNAEPGSLEKTCYHTIWRALRKYQDPALAASDMRSRCSLAHGTAKPYYQEAVDMLTGKAHPQNHQSWPRPKFAETNGQNASIVEFARYRLDNSQKIE